MSVRSRLEARAYEEPETSLDSNRPKSTLVVGNVAGRSLRSRTEEVASTAHGDPVTRLPVHRATGLTANGSFNESVRSRMQRQADDAKEKAQPPTKTVADFYFAEYQRDEEKRRAERDAEIQSGRLTIL